VSGSEGMARFSSKLPRVVLVLAGILLVGDQVVNRTALADGVLFGRRIAPFDPPLFWRDHERALGLVERHLATGDPPRSEFRHDAELGWGHNPAAAEELDWAGARGSFELERVKPEGVRRIAVFGSSFTYGTEVAPGETWTAQLERLASTPGRRVEVVNMGVEAYGIDQAFLRWRRDGGVLAADEVWLSFPPQAALKVVTTYVPALSHWAPGVAFKPRFTLAPDGTLVLVPNPAPALADVARVLRHQDEFLAAVGPSDAWVARAPAAYAPEGSRWSHRSAVARFLLTSLERRGRDPAPWLAADGGEVFSLVRAITGRMRREVEASGARFRLLVLPDRPLLSERDSDGGRPWDGLVAALRADGVAVSDLSPALAGADDERLWAPTGHYSIAGNGVIAEALRTALGTER